MMDSLMHGWSGLAAAYAAVQGPMIASLARERARAHHYLASPLIAAPLMVMAQVGAALLPGHGLMQWGVAAGLSALLGYSGGRAIARGEEADPLRHQRGSLVQEDFSRPASRRGSSRVREEARELRLTLAGQEVPAQDETKHFKFIGTTGTGKSTAIQEIMSTALARGDRAVIADPDGGYMRRFYREERGDLILNPFDARSAKWDLFAEIDSAHDVEQLARSLIPDHEGQDRSWRGYARTFFTAVTRQAHEAGISDVGELYRLLVVADNDELRTLVRGTPAQPFLDEHNSRMFDSIRSVTSSAVGALEHVAAQTAAGLSVRRWVGEKSPGVLFIPYKAGEIAALSASISAWMRLAIFETMNQGEREEAAGHGAARDDAHREDSRRGAGRNDARSGNQRLWIVIDELDALGPIDGLKDALARLRKFDAGCILGLQSISQASSTYGRGDAHTIIENCGNTVILRCSASEGGGTARFASQLIGEREVLRTMVSKSRRPSEVLSSVTHSQHVSVEPAVLPSQIEQLPDLTGYLKFASDPQWRRVRLDARREWEPRQVRPAAPAARASLTRRGPDHEPRSHPGAEYD